MDDYPKDLAPENSNDLLNREKFSVWWLRVFENFPSVPKNVAKQWIHRHWGHSPYSWIRSQDTVFDLIQMGNSEVTEIFTESGLVDTDEAVQWGQHLRSQGRRRGELRYRLAAIMERRGTWPIPIIVLLNDGSFKEIAEFPKKIVLIEGHRRLAIMRSLIADGLTGASHYVWRVKRATE